MAVYRTGPGQFVISSADQWLPGVYESEQAARYAFRFSDAQLHRLQESVNHRADPADRVITFEMLQEERRRGMPPVGAVSPPVQGASAPA